MRRFLELAIAIVLAVACSAIIIAVLYSEYPLKP
jgi:hypothetical protein